MKSDETTKSAGYASVFGFNARQLTRYLAGEVRPKIDKAASFAANDCQIVEDATIKQGWQCEKCTTLILIESFEAKQSQ